MHKANGTQGVVENRKIKLWRMKRAEESRRERERERERERDRERGSTSKVSVQNAILLELS